MNAFLRFIFVFSLLLPSVALADVADQCSSGGADCFCLTDEPFNSTVTAISQCAARCEGEQSVNPNVTGYQVQCLGSGETIASVTFASETPTTAPVSNETEFPLLQLNVDIPGLNLTAPTTESGVVKSNYIGEYIEAIYKWLLGAAAVVAVVIIMVAGIQWVLAAGNASQVSRAKERINNAITGLILILAAVTISEIIDPSLSSLDPISVLVVEKIEIPNETPADFFTDFEIVSTPGNGGAGWNSVPTYDQKAYADTAYGPPNCKTETSGNIKSSGCGVVSFTMAASALGTNLTPEVVADTFYEEGFRPLDQSGCGYNGTSSTAFVESSFITSGSLKSRYVPISDTAQILDLLGKGKLIIVSYETKSGGGHYVVLTGLDEQGNLLINNPWGGTMEKTPPSNLFGRLKSAVYIDRPANFIE